LVEPQKMTVRPGQRRLPRRATAPAREITLRPVEGEQHIDALINCTWAFLLC
jgi:hypothetical protein